MLLSDIHANSTAQHDAEHFLLSYCVLKHGHQDDNQDANSQGRSQPRRVAGMLLTAGFTWYPLSCPPQPAAHGWCSGRTRRRIPICQGKSPGALCQSRPLCDKLPHPTGCIRPCRTQISCTQASKGCLHEECPCKGVAFFHGFLQLPSLQYLVRVNRGAGGGEMGIWPDSV